MSGAPVIGAPKRVVLRIASVLLGASLGACSLLGTPGSPPGPVPHAGTGQFRSMITDETGIGAVPQGAAVVTSGDGVDNAMVADGHLFYAAADLIPVDAGMRDAGTDADVDAGDPLDAGDLDAGVDAAMPRDASIPRDANVDSGVPPERDAVDWSRFEPRAIFHSEPGASWGFVAGDVVFEADEAWEGGYVTDPCVIGRADGSYLLFYGAAGGIGVARATAIGGPYTRVAGPLSLGAGVGVPRRPAAVLSAELESPPPFEVLFYYELDGAIHVAGFDGDDATEIATLAPTPLPQRDDRDGDETGIGSPGAIVLPTPAGRSIVRIYYESRRSNGTTLVALMASSDGLAFDAFERPVFAERDRQSPWPRAVDGRTTVLYTWVPYRQTGALINSVTPAAVSLVGVTPPR